MQSPYKAIPNTLLGTHSPMCVWNRRYQLNNAVYALLVRVLQWLRLMAVNSWLSVATGTREAPRRGGGRATLSCQYYLFLSRNFRTKGVKIGNL